MKNQIPVYIIIISSLAFNSWAQKNPLNEKKAEGMQNNAPILRDRINAPLRKVKYYHVEEIIDLKFGGHKTVYNVTNPKLIQTYDLGPNNKRIITPVFEKGEQIVETILKSDALKKIEISTKSPITDIPQKVDIINLEQENKKIETPLFPIPKEKLDETAITLNALNKIENSNKLSISDKPKKVDTSAYIDIIKTYERVVEKGYEPIEILKKLADSYFFNNELENSEKYYGKLFGKTTDLEPEYYYRYSAALRSKGQIEMADQYLKKFNELSADNSKE
jgi:hypothetical protein